MHGHSVVSPSLTIPHAEESLDAESPHVHPEHEEVELDDQKIMIEAEAIQSLNVGLSSPARGCPLFRPIQSCGSAKDYWQR